MLKKWKISQAMLDEAVENSVLKAVPRLKRRAIAGEVMSSQSSVESSWRDVDHDRQLVMRVDDGGDAFVDGICVSAWHLRVRCPKARQKVPEDTGLEVQNPSSSSCPPKWSINVYL